MAERGVAEKRRGGDQMGRAEWHCSRESSSSPGCMGGVFHHLHFHHLLFAANSSCCRVPSASSPPSSFSSSSSSSLPPPIDRTTLQEQQKGLEAPRNSLELDEGKASSSASSAMEEEFFKDVPVAVEIVPPAASLSRSRNRKMLVMSSEEKKRSCSSQAETPRTPSLVARLMGLEISAEQSPSSTPKTPPWVELRAQTKKINAAAVEYQRGNEPPLQPRQPLRSLTSNVNSSAAAGRVGVLVDVGSRSLPESPRTSTSARSCDADRRLSLQINKENICHLCEVVGDCSLPPSPSAPCSSTRLKKKDPGSWYVNVVNKSPTAKKVEENLNEEIKSKSRRTRPPEKKLPVAPDPPPSSIYSPQIRFLEFANSSDDDDLKKRPSMAPPKPSNVGGSGGGDREDAKLVKVAVSKCKKADYERFTGRIKNQTPNSPCGSRSFPTLATLFQPAHAPPDQRNLPDKNNSIYSPSIFASSRVKEASQATSLPPNSPSGGGLEESKTETKNRQRRALKEKDPEFGYIKTIFEHAKISGARSWRWYSRLLPIDPVVFHRLELEFPFFLINEEDCASRRLLGHLRHRWNRKLLFHLVQEILGDLLAGSSNINFSFSFTTAAAAGSSLTRCENRNADDGEALLRELVARIESFPEADCRVVGDVDALVAGDLAEATVRRLPLHASVVEEACDVASEVEQEILHDLLGETAASLALITPPPGLRCGFVGAIDRATSSGGTVPWSRKRRGMMRG